MSTRLQEHGQVSDKGRSETSTPDILDLYLPDGTLHKITYEDIRAAVTLARQRYRDFKLGSNKARGKAADYTTKELPYHLGTYCRLPSSKEYDTMGTERRHRFTNAILLTRECLLQEQAQSEHSMYYSVWPEEMLHRDAEVLTNGKTEDDLTDDQKEMLRKHRKKWKSDGMLGALKSERRESYLHAHLRLRNAGLPFPAPWSGYRPVTLRTIKEGVDKKHAYREAKKQKQTRGRGDGEE
jgi:hypothetical protein